MQQMRVRGIYPVVEGYPPLRWMNEIGAVAEIPGVELKITGGPDVKEPQVAQALRDEAELFILSGHGYENGFLLSNKRVVRGRWIATQARGKERAPRAIILASCGSGCSDSNNDSLTWQIAKAGISAIGMPPKVPDDAALCYVVEFVRALVAGADTGEAHDVAVDSLEDQWASVAREIVMLPGLTNGYRFIIERLTKLEQGQERTLTLLEQVVNGRNGHGS